MDNAPVDSGQLLIQFTRDRDVHCPQCEYNLRDLASPACPECGEALILSVNSAEPKQTLLIAGLIGLCAGGGLNGLLLLYMGIMEIRDESIAREEFWRFLGVNGGGFLVLGIAIYFWLRRWKSIRRRNRRARLVLVAICWSLSLIDLLIFSFLIR